MRLAGRCQYVRVDCCVVTGRRNRKVLPAAGRVGVDLVVLVVRSLRAMDVVCYQVGPGAVRSVSKVNSIRDWSVVGSDAAPSFEEVNGLDNGRDPPTRYALARIRTVWTGSVVNCVLAPVNARRNAR